MAPPLKKIMKSTMNVAESPALSPYSARKMTKPVNFYCPASPGASQVNLAADFNGWDPDSLPAVVSLFCKARLHIRIAKTISINYAGNLSS